MADDNEGVADSVSDEDGDGEEDPWQDSFHDYCVDGVASCLYGDDTERDGVDGSEKTGAKIPSLMDKLLDCDTLTFPELLEMCRIILRIL